MLLFAVLFVLLWFIGWLVLTVFLYWIGGGR